MKKIYIKILNEVKNSKNFTELTAAYCINNPLVDTGNFQEVKDSIIEQYELKLKHL